MASTGKMPATKLNLTDQPTDQSYRDVMDVQNKRIKVPYVFENAN